MITTGSSYLTQASYLTSNQRRKILQLPQQLQERLIVTLKNLSGSHGYKRIDVLLGKIDGGTVTSIAALLG